ncbi:hypothetical protein FO519_000534 [Halicephalobus sp. NKZ332]|nr:hypothetical protein FO519_000534 [Halicephalobus sp. NKZ332]
MTSEDLFVCDSTTILQQLSMKENVDIGVETLEEEKPVISEERVDFDLDEFEREVEEERKFINSFQLSPPPQKLEDRTWNQIEVFSPSKSLGEVILLDHSIPSLELESSSTISKPENQEDVNEEKVSKVKVRKIIEYPVWLKLLPPKDDDSGRPSTGTARLLDLEAAIRSNRSARSTKREFFEPLRSHDSGFLEVTTPEQRKEGSEKLAIGFSCTMTEAQINELMGICN